MITEMHSKFQDRGTSKITCSHPWGALMQQDMNGKC